MEKYPQSHIKPIKSRDKQVSKSCRQGTIVFSRRSRDSERVDNFHMGQHIAPSLLAWVHCAQGHNTLEALTLEQRHSSGKSRSKGNDMGNSNESIRDPSCIAIKRQTCLVRIRILPTGMIFALEGVCEADCVCRQLLKGLASLGQGKNHFVIIFLFR